MLFHCAVSFCCGFLSSPLFSASHLSCYKRLTIFSFYKTVRFVLVSCSNVCWIILISFGKTNHVIWGISSSCSGHTRFESKEFILCQYRTSWFSWVFQGKFWEAYHLIFLPNPYLLTTDVFSVGTICITISFATPSLNSVKSIGYKTPTVFGGYVWTLPSVYIKYIQGFG